MKLKITIKGLKVHDVGSRPWLTELAMNTALRGFEVYNDEENGQQAVIALIEADEQRTKRFYNLVKTQQPQLAQVSEVTSEDYTGDIMPVWQAATMGSFTQLNKAIPVLLKIAENTDMIPQMAKNTEKILEEVKSLREDQPSFATQLRQLQSGMKTVKDRLGIQ
jgi:hydrogenase maturation factor HypF (carbamoyltransferase family)